MKFLMKYVRKKKAGTLKDSKEQERMCSMGLISYI